jgi:hypothetical protein
MEAAIKIGRAIYFLIILLIILLTVSPPVNANTITFSGLNQTNKTLDVYDINAIAPGNESGFVSTINNTDVFYFEPGDSYNFQISTKKNTTFLSDPLSFGAFVFSSKGEALVYFGVLLFLGAALCCGLFIMGRRR